MFSQTSLTNRRQFLERSMLGFGSAFLLPSLLASCTDHQIPPDQPVIIPTPIIKPPLLGDYEIDWDDAAKTAVVAGIGMIPEVGEILGPLVDIFWPENKPSVWDQVKLQVEQLVKEEIGSFEYELVSEDLEGLKNLLTVYLDELNDGTNEEKLIQWISVSNAFTNVLPHFQSKDYQLPLLGLFTQFANMYLSVLRDVVIQGTVWGRTDADHARDQTHLTKYIQDFTAYTNTVYKTGRDNLAAKTQFIPSTVDPFRTLNGFDRQMAFLVLDFRDAWQYFDVTKYPAGATAILTREIYSDPVGVGTNPDSSLAFNVVTPPPTQPLTHIAVWSGKYLDAIQMTYPSGGGPNHATQTPKYGSQSGNPVVHGVDISIDNPITKVTGLSGEIVNQVQFYFNNGNSTPAFGWESGSPYEFAYTNEILSSIKIDGPGNIKDDQDSEAANFIVFGFQFWLSTAATLSAIGNLYVKSPKERSAADFAKAYPKSGISANSINDELRAARQTYWASVKARAKALK